MAGVEALQRRFEIASTDHRRRSPFNAHLLGCIARRGDIAGLLRAAPEEQQLPVLLLAAVHSIVLAEPDLELAAWYPTAVREPRGDDPFPAFARLCAARGDQIRAIVASRSTQTNEIARCATFLPPLALLAQERGTLGLVEIGASAGLNLLLDRYDYRYDTQGGRSWTIGGRSPVMLPCGVRGDPPLPVAIPPIGMRLGVDREPVDLGDPDGVRWLLACVWPDQPERVERLQAAIALAVRHPVEVMQGDAVDMLAPAVDRIDRETHPVVLTSWVLNYLTVDARTAFLERLERIGGERDASWLAFESPGMCPGLPFPSEIAGSFLTHLVLTRWRGGRRTVVHLAECHPHGAWMHWEP